jgi:hypothetical protein
MHQQRHQRATLPFAGNRIHGHIHSTHERRHHGEDGHHGDQHRTAVANGERNQPDHARPHKAVQRGGEQTAAVAPVVGCLLTGDDEDLVQHDGAREGHESIFQSGHASPAAKLARGALGHHAAVRHNHDTVAQFPHLVEHMAGEDNARPGVAHPPQKEAQRAHRGHVQPVGWFIQHEIPRRMNQGAPQGGLHPLPLREAESGAIGHRLHSEEGDHFLHPFTKAPTGDPVQASGKGEGLTRGQPRVQPRVVQQAANAPL